VKDFRNLKVWERSHQLVLRVYDHTRPFPKDELYGLTSQLRRATASIPTNIAEGCGRGTDPDFARFLQMAMGSASETDYLLLLSKDLCYLSEAEYLPLLATVTEVKRMLIGLLAKLRAASQGP
jgi:four helix bundle protein